LQVAGCKQVADCKAEFGTWPQCLRFFWPGIHTPFWPCISRCPRRTSGKAGGDSDARDGDGGSALSENGSESREVSRCSGAVTAVRAAKHIDIVVAGAVGSMQAPAPPAHIGQLFDEASSQSHTPIDVNGQLGLQSSVKEKGKRKLDAAGGKKASFARPADGAAAAVARKRKVADALCADELEGRLQVLQTWLAEAGVPKEAWPTTPPKGLKNYTVQSVCGATIEVQHVAGTFFVKKASGGNKLGVGISPNVKWAKNDGPEAAWSNALNLAGVTQWQPRIP